MKEITKVKANDMVRALLTAEALTVSFALSRAEKITDLVYDIIGNYSFIGDDLRRN